MRIAIVGAAGRMGRKLCELAAPPLEVCAKVDVAEGYAREWGADAEGVVDFSFHEAVPGTLARAVAQGIPCVVGTTALDAAERRAVEEASRRIPVVWSGNYSLGVNVMLGLVRRAASLMGPEYDIEIAEMHHRHKKDAPSGTAVMLAEAAAAGRGADLAASAIYGRKGVSGERPYGEIAIHALRGGSVVGDHTVMFAGELERLELVHRAQDRAAFAAGALRAVLWAAGRAPGLYTMQHVLGFESP